MNLDPKLRSLIAEFFNKSIADVNIDSSKDDIEEWDSLEHIKLVLEIEEKCNVKFSLDIIPNLTSVKAIQEELNKKML
jgi:acyl carrier protein